MPVNNPPFSPLANYLRLSAGMHRVQSVSLRSARTEVRIGFAIAMATLTGLSLLKEGLYNSGFG